MTIEELKSNLPDVKIRIEGWRTTYTAELRGRRLTHAVVYVNELSSSFQFSWDDVLQAVNKKRILKAKISENQPY